MSDSPSKKDSRAPRDTDISNVNPDHPYALTTPAQPLVADGAIALGFHAPPLGLPMEFRADTTPAPPPAMDETAHDAWTTDRFERGGRPSTVPPPVELTSDFPDEATDAVSLIDRTRPASAEHDLTGEMVERFALGDFTGALRIAELLLGQDADSQTAQDYAVLCRKKLLELYEARVGGASRIPYPIALGNDRRWLGLDRRAASVYRRVDGVTSCKALVAQSTLAELEAWQALVELYEAGAIQSES
ncbi:MAG: hypothetical protein IPK60_21735 [Sandaracinaceae bacterium]|nr:hypothetical protein [Sandaracinaceae bacterium]